MTTATKAKRETWRDWMPASVDLNPETLLTRDQLLDRLKRKKIDATTSDLRYWEYSGALPRPVRRWHNGAVRALYPPWFVDIIGRMRELQKDGLTLEEIGPRLRALIRVRYGDDPLDEEIRNYSARQVHGPKGPEDLLLTWEALRDLHKLAEQHARITGVPTDRIEVRVYDVAGNWTRYPLPVAGTEQAETTESFEP